MLDGKISNSELMVWFEFGLAGAAILGGIILGFFRWFRKSKKPNYYTAHNRIYEILTELRITSDCARAQVVQFHNGEYFMDGISMRRKSLTHESLNPAVSGEADKKQNLQLSLFIPLMNIIMDEKCDLEIISQKEDSYCKKYMESSQVVAFMALPLKHKNNVSGYLMLQWCSLGKLDDVNEAVSSDILRKSRDLIEVELTRLPKK